MVSKGDEGVGDAFGAAAVAVGVGDAAVALGDGVAVGAADGALATTENKAKMIANNDCMYFLRTIAVLRSEAQRDLR